MNFIHVSSTSQSTVKLPSFRSTQVGITVKPGQAYPQESINEHIIQKLNPLLVVDFRLISVFLYV